MADAEHPIGDPSAVVDMAAFKAAKEYESLDPIGKFLSLFDHVPADDAEAAGDDRPPYMSPTDEEVAEAVQRGLWTLGLGDSPPLSADEQALLESIKVNGDDPKRYDWYRTAADQLTASRDAKRLESRPADEQ